MYRDYWLRATTGYNDSATATYPLATGTVTDCMHVQGCELGVCYATGTGLVSEVKYV